MIAVESAPTADECLEALRTGLLRARFLLGCRWSGLAGASAVSGPERFELGLLLDAPHNMSAYLRGLGAKEPDPACAHVARRGLEDFRAVYDRLGLGIYGSSARQLEGHVPTPTTSASHDPLDNDGPFGPCHEA